MNVEQFPATARPRKSFVPARVVSRQINSHSSARIDHTIPVRTARVASKRANPEVAAFKPLRRTSLTSEATPVTKRLHLSPKIPHVNLAFSAASTPLQKSAQLVENKHSQVYCAQLIAHSLSLFSCKSCICHSYAKHTRGWGGTHLIWRARTARWRGDIPRVHGLTRGATAIWAELTRTERRETAVVAALSGKPPNRVQWSLT
jgi:hypothetical protein